MAHRISDWTLAVGLLIAGCSGPPVSDGGVQDAGDAAWDAESGLADGAIDVGVDSGGGSGAVFPESVTNGGQASLAIDSSGGVHLVYAASSAYQGVTPVRYGYCAAECVNAANWTFATVGDVGIETGEARLELDLQGRPRVLYYSASTLDDGAYWYAACDGSCTTEGNWSRTRLTLGSSPSRSRYFALDPTGHPSFVYTDSRATHRGAFFAGCVTSCDTAANWHEVSFGSYLFSQLALAYTPTGGVRIAYRTDSQLAYVGCDSACGTASSWQGAPLYDLGDGASFALRIDSLGHPRLAFYSGYITSGATSDVLEYAACDSNCAAAAGWTGRTLGLPVRYGAGGIDLALDSQNRPRIAFNVDTDPYGLGYAGCDADCQSLEATWSSGLIEDSAALDRADPVPIASGCSLSVWFVGMNPALALDSSGLPRIAYDATHMQGGSCSVHTDIALVRFAALSL